MRQIPMQMFYSTGMPRVGNCALFLIELNHSSGELFISELDPEILLCKPGSEVLFLLCYLHVSSSCLGRRVFYWSATPFWWFIHSLKLHLHPPTDNHFMSHSGLPLKKKGESRCMKDSCIVTPKFSKKWLIYTISVPKHLLDWFIFSSLKYNFHGTAFRHI